MLALALFRVSDGRPEHLERGSFEASSIKTCFIQQGMLYGVEKAKDGEIGSMFPAMHLAQLLFDHV